MEAKYMVGQRVIIQPVKEGTITIREDEVSRFAGQVGQVSDFYWISPRAGFVFYIYNVRVGRRHKDLVVYEDELEPCLS